jgi:hypothetical protein
MYELISRFSLSDKITLLEESLLATICQYNPSSSTCVSPSSFQVGKEKFIQRKTNNTPEDAYDAISSSSYFVVIID